jgi:hypothetical protein
MNYETTEDRRELGRAMANRADIPQPKDPGLIDRLKETLGYLSQLSEIHGNIRLHLVGPEPSDPSSSAKSAHEPSVEDLVRMICERTAMSVGDAKSICARF